LFTQDQSSSAGGVPPRTFSNHSDHSDKQSKASSGSVPPRTTSNRSDTDKLIDASANGGNFFSLPDPSVEVGLIEDCFGNVRDLREFTKTFLDDLEKGYSEQNIAPCFLKHCDDDFLYLYYNYMRVYKEASFSTFSRLVVTAFLKIIYVFC
jgi:hypothetical protein